MQTSQASTQVGRNKTGTELAVLRGSFWNGSHLLSFPMQAPVLGQSQRLREGAQTRILVLQSGRIQARPMGASEEGLPGGAQPDGPGPEGRGHSGCERGTQGRGGRGHPARCSSQASPTLPGASCHPPQLPALGPHSLQPKSIRQDSFPSARRPPLPWTRQPNQRWCFPPLLLAPRPRPRPLPVSSQVICVENPGQKQMFLSVLTTLSSCVLLPRSFSFPVPNIHGI